MKNDSVRNILFVCIGNICRSPMAEGMLRQMMPDKVVFSAGIHPLIGEAADPIAVRLMAERCIDISTHRARGMASWMVNDADLVLTMDQYQKRFIEFKYPAARGKVIRLGDEDGYDIPDPYQQNPGAFRQCSQLIALGIDRLVDRLGSETIEMDGMRFARPGMEGLTLRAAP